MATQTVTSTTQYGENIIVLPATAQLQALLTVIRDEKTGRYVIPRQGVDKFADRQWRLCLVRHGAYRALRRSYSDRIIRLLVEEGEHLRGSQDGACHTTRHTSGTNHQASTTCPSCPRLFAPPLESTTMESPLKDESAVSRL